MNKIKNERKQKERSEEGKQQRRERSQIAQHLTGLTCLSGCVAPPAGWSRDTVSVSYQQRRVLSRGHTLSHPSRISVWRMASPHSSLSR